MRKKMRCEDGWATVEIVAVGKWRRDDGVATDASWGAEDGGATTDLRPEGVESVWK